MEQENMLNTIDRVNPAPESLRPVSRKKEIFGLIFAVLFFLVSFDSFIIGSVLGMSSGEYFFWMFFGVVFNILLFLIIRSQKLSSVTEGIFVIRGFLVVDVLFVLISFVIGDIAINRLQRTFSALFFPGVTFISFAQSLFVSVISFSVVSLVGFLGLVNLIYFFRNKYSSFSSSFSLTK